ncbi:MAG TPA: alpha-L-fucosidase, partial [Verrucomicrobiae bacterium]|nr:alpha-L-fucosidase [Verrucomicrobiae bacterium]
AFVTQKAPWKLGETREVVLTSVRASDQTTIGVLGQNDKVLEYSDVIPKTTWNQKPDGLHIHFFQAQRLRDNRQWSNPVVLKITHATPVEGQIRVETVRGQWDGTSGVARLEGKLIRLGSASEVEAGFEYRDITGLDVSERSGQWLRPRLMRLTATGSFSAEVIGLKSGDAYEFRAITKSSTLTVFGREMEFNAK